MKKSILSIISVIILVVGIILLASCSMPASQSTTVEKQNQALKLDNQGFKTMISNSGYYVLYNRWRTSWAKNIVGQGFYGSMMSSAYCTGYTNDDLSDWQIVPVNNSRDCFIINKKTGMYLGDDPTNKITDNRGYVYGPVLSYDLAYLDWSGLQKIGYYIWRLINSPNGYYYLQNAHTLRFLNTEYSANLTATKFPGSVPGWNSAEWLIYKISDFGTEKRPLYIYPGYYGIKNYGFVNYVYNSPSGDVYPDVAYFDTYQNTDVFKWQFIRVTSNQYGDNYIFMNKYDNKILESNYANPPGGYPHFVYLDGIFSNLNFRKMLWKIEPDSNNVWAKIKNNYTGGYLHTKSFELGDHSLQITTDVDYAECYWGIDRVE